MFGLIKGNSSAITHKGQNAIQLASAVAQPTKFPRGHYDRRSTGVSADFVYQPDGYERQCVAGGYGEMIEYEGINLCELAASLPSESFRGISIHGTPAAIEYGKRLVCHFDVYGYGHGYVFDVTKTVIIKPVKGIGGLGSCPGSTILVCPISFGEDLNTFYHEYCHNLGWDHKYDAQGRQIDTANDPIYIDAALAGNHLSSLPEAGGPAPRMEDFM